jgi:Zn-dependent protease
MIGIEATLNRIPLLIALIPVLIIHEVAHAWAALKLGDSTAKDEGRLTLNPLKHLDPVGTLMLVFVGFGFAKPVPVDSSNFKRRKWDMAIVAAAGPLANFVLAAFLALISRILYAMGVTESFLQYVWGAVAVTIVLGVFNLLPLPPLDGSKILYALFIKNVDAYERATRGGMWSLIAVMVLAFTGLLWQLIFPVVDWIFGLLMSLMFIF